MPLMSSSGLGDGIKSTDLIGVVTQNIWYAKSLLQGRLKYLPITKVEFHCLTRLSPTQFSIPELFLAASSKESVSFKTRIDYSKVPCQSIISHSMACMWLYLVLFGSVWVFIGPRASDLLSSPSHSFYATWPLRRSLGHAKCAAVSIWGCELLSF